MTERDVLRKAKEVLVARGLHKGGYCANDDLTGPVCMAGACNLAATGDPFTPPRGFPKTIAWQFADELLSVHLHKKGPFGFDSVPGFNDWTTTTLEDAVAVFDRAIASLPTDPSPQEEVVEVAHA